MRRVLGSNATAVCLLGGLLFLPILRPLGSVLSFETNAEATSTSPDSEAAKLENHIAQLITSLGSDKYATRHQAQLELEQIGVPALDQLQQAQLNSDPQIATAAKYMIRSSYIRWTGNDDPLSVRRLLDQYGSGDGVYRSERIDRLSKLPNRQGLPALLRIVRYETSVELGKRAALALMRAILPAKKAIQVNDVVDNQKSQWLAIIDAMGNAEGTSVGWLRTLATNGRDNVPMDSKWWQDAIDHEFLLVANNQGGSSRVVVSDFTRWVAEILVIQGQRDAALEIAKNLLRITYSNRERPKIAEDLYLWALDHELPEIVISHSTQFLEDVEKVANQAQNSQQGAQSAAQWIASDRSIAWFSIKLRYLRAEAYRQLNNFSEADRESLAAFTRLGDKELVGIADRNFHGDFLRKRLEYDWAERELQEAWSIAQQQRIGMLSIGSELSELLTDGENYVAAEKVLRTLVERLEIDPDFVRETDEVLPVPIFLPDDQTVLFSQRLRATWLYCRAKAKLQSNESDSAWDDLQQALVCDPENVDIIIAMMELTKNAEKTVANTSKENQTARRKQAEKAFATTVVAFRESLPRLEKSLATSSNNDGATRKREYSNALNTYAWLLASTDHDLSTALEYSDLACRLTPNNPAFLDTLARCYFKNGNVTEAISIQEQAVAASPDLRELRRNLESFQSALKQ